MHIFSHGRGRIADPGGANMLDDKLKGPLDLQYKPEPRPETSPEMSSADSALPKPEVGPSSLVGRRGDNLTFHTQGAYKEGFFSLLWNWAWKDLAVAFLSLFRIFIPTKRD